jgi:BMFP domain-containing protein YqiC
MPIDPKAIDELARKLAAAVPDGVRQVQRDLEANFRSVLASALGKLDLVTREEFEVQQQVLARTRERLEQLGARLVELESALKPDKKG